MDEEQDEVVDEATHRPNLLLEEIARPKRLRVALDELDPGALASLGPQVESVLAQDCLDGRLTDRDAELLQFADDATEAPAIFVRQAEDRSANVDRRLRTAPLAGLRFSRRAGGIRLEPASESSVRNDADQLADLGSKRLTELEQLSFLGTRHVDSSGQLGSQDAVLGLEELDHLGQLVIRGVSQESQKPVPNRRHGHLSVSRWHARAGQVSVPRLAPPSSEKFRRFDGCGPSHSRVLLFANNEARLAPAACRTGWARFLICLKTSFRTGRPAATSG